MEDSSAERDLLVLAKTVAADQFPVERPAVFGVDRESGRLERLSPFPWKTTDTDPDHPARTSKHLRVLREVGLVRVREAGQQRLYGLDARGLEPVHEWVIGFEQYWNENFDRLNEYVKELQRKEHADGSRR